MIQQGRPSIITLRPGAAPPAPVELPAPAPPRRALAWLKLAGVFTLSALLLGAGAAAGLARYGGAYTRSAFRTTASSLDAMAIVSPPAGTSVACPARRLTHVVVSLLTSNR